MHETMNWSTNDAGMQTATPSAAFWDAWRVDKYAVKANGYSVSKTEDGWVVSFKDLKPAIELSRALDYDIEIPTNEGLTFFDYQKAGIAFAKDKNALIADEPGLGKTLQAAGVINLHPEYRNILIICPNSVKINWKRELTKWLVNPYTIGIVNRGDYPDTDIIIINYDVAEKHKEKLHAVDWDLLVADEAHLLKTSTSQRTKAILGKGKKLPGIPAKHKIFLTGTPVLNRPVELFPLLHALDPETWGSAWQFKQRYCGAVHNGWGWDFSGATNLEELNMKLRSSTMIRRTKAEALPELPPVFHQIIELPPVPALAKLLKEEDKVWSAREELISSLRAAVELAKVSENSEDYAQAVDNLKKGMNATFAEMAELRQKIAIEKVPYTLEHLADINEKVVIFFHHKEVGRRFKEALGDRAVMLVGDTKTEDRQAAVDSFRNDPKIQYFLGSLSAAGVGLTLAPAAKICLFHELSFTPAMIEQGWSRLHRIGAVDNILVQYLVLENSLDAKMAQDLVDKQRVISQALDAHVSELEISVPGVADHVKVPRDVTVEPVSDEEKAELLAKLRILASYDTDKAQVRNNLGFSKVDSSIGHSLASFSRLTDKQCVLARALCTKYRRQLT